MTEIVKVGLDAGHGGAASGATRPWFAQTEAEFNMMIARRVLSAIRVSGLPFDPILLRTRDDETMSLHERGEKSAALGCKLVLHFHVNSALKTYLRGGLCFHWPGNERAASLGGMISSALPKPLYNRPYSIEATDLPGQDDDWLERPRAVMKPHAATTVLLECGYMSNTSDAAELQKEAVQAGIVQAVLVGLCDYWRTTP